MQIEKLDLQRRKSFGTLDWLNNNGEPSGAELIENKINEIIHELNHILEERESEIKVCEEAQDMYDNAILDALKDKQVDVVVEPAENVEPDYVTTSYMTDGNTKEYYGQNGASIITDHPLPTGYFITIKEPETKGGDNE